MRRSYNNLAKGKIITVSVVLSGLQRAYIKVLSLDSLRLVLGGLTQFNSKRYSGLKNGIHAVIVA